jgi:four helix bundle protein
MVMQGFRDLDVYRYAYELVSTIFTISRGFPKEERYALTDQIRHSSRSVVANIAEGYRKRQYPKMFAAKCADADGEAAETQVWLDIARDCDYISREQHAQLISDYERVGRLLGVMIAAPEKYAPRANRQ